MTLLVRNEDDILEANMRYHLDQGVSHIIVTDNLSTDGTRDIVEDYVRQGVATYIYQSDNHFAQSDWVSHMARLAYDRPGTRWVMHSDADEFWVPDRAGGLARYFGRRLLSNVVKARRHDFICLEDDDRPFWDRMIWRKTTSLNANGVPLPPKVAHRAHKAAVVLNGNHKVEGVGRRRIHDKGLEILHFPLRSRQQYLRKIQTGAQALMNNPELPENIGSTWRAQYRELQETGRIAFLEENVVSADSLAKREAEGRIVRDPRLQAYFKSKGH